MKIVFDTNIYLAATNSKSLCFELIQQISDPKSQNKLFISKEIIFELEGKLKDFVSKRLLSGDEARTFLILVGKTTNLATPLEKLKFVKRDPSDDKILECAVAAEADLIITMDKDLLKLKRFRSIGIVHPKTFSYMIYEN